MDRKCAGELLFFQSKIKKKLKFAINIIDKNRTSVSINVACEDIILMPNTSGKKIAAVIDNG